MFPDSSSWTPPLTRVWADAPTASATSSVPFGAELDTYLSTTAQVTIDPLTLRRVSVESQTTAQVWGVRIHNALVDLETRFVEVSFVVIAVALVALWMYSTGSLWSQESTHVVSSVADAKHEYALGVDAILELKRDVSDVLSGRFLDGFTNSSY